MTAPIEVSVVLCAARPGPAARFLEALCGQTLGRDAFEVVVVTEAEQHPAREAARSCRERLALRLGSAAGGVAAMRNQGLSLAAGRVVLFADEREVPGAGLLEAHLAAHRANPDPALAVVGRIQFSAALARDPLVHFAAGPAAVLADPSLEDGDVRDFTSFWPGRCSVKRELLARSGGFDARFVRGDDHAELGFRLTPQGFRVLHAAGAVSALVDGLELDELCGWLRDQGASRYLFAALHPRCMSLQDTGVEAAAAVWRESAASREDVLRSARSLEVVVRRSMADGVPVSAEEVMLLHRAYRAAFALSRAQGMAEQAAAEGRELEAFAGARRPPGRAPDPGAPAVSIVIPIAEERPCTGRCLDAVARNAGASSELIVVDDSSSGAVAAAARRTPRARVLREGARAGLLQALNRGAAVARGRWILLLADDVEPQPGWAEALLAVAESRPEVGAVGSQLLRADGRLHQAGGVVFRDGRCSHFGQGDLPGRGLHQRTCEVDFCSRASLLVRRELFERLDGFDTRFAPGSHADADLCLGIRSLGYRVLYCPGSVAIHAADSTSGVDRAAGAEQEHERASRKRLLSRWRETLSRHEPAQAGHGPPTADRVRRLRLPAALEDPTSPALVRAGPASPVATPSPDSRTSTPP